jgi:hypothetical protein
MTVLSLTVGITGVGYNALSTPGYGVVSRTFVGPFAESSPTTDPSSSTRPSGLIAISCCICRPASRYLLMRR